MYSMLRHFSFVSFSLVFFTYLFVRALLLIDETPLGRSPEGGRPDTLVDVFWERSEQCVARSNVPPCMFYEACLVLITIIVSPRDSSVSAQQQSSTLLHTSNI